MMERMEQFAVHLKFRNGNTQSCYFHMDRKGPCIGALKVLVAIVPNIGESLQEIVIIDRFDPHIMRTVTVEQFIEIGEAVLVGYVPFYKSSDIKE